MKIWLINHYAVPPHYYPLSRPSLFAKNLIKMGHDVTIIAASTVHNSDNQNLIENGVKVKHIIDDGIPYVLINCLPYRGNGIKRVINILQFSQELPGVLKTLDQPDAIVATSFDPFTCYEGIKYAKKHGIRAIAEIADLWPETLVDYSGLSPKHPAVKYLRTIEKKIYISADRIVFTMEGAYKYIEEQGWTQVIPKTKVCYINNGIDNELFSYNKDNYRISDKDLEDDSKFKVVYTGSIRKVNNLGILLDAAELINDEKIIFLIWGDGDELEILRDRVKRDRISNVVFKGKVEKKYIPYITSKADLNIAHNGQSKLFRFGISFNKIFDYLAAGKPILCDFDSGYNPVIQNGAGVEVKSAEPREIAEEIVRLSNVEARQYLMLSENALKAAKKYDFSVLTQKLADVIESI